MKRVIGVILFALVVSVNVQAQAQAGNNKIEFLCKKDTAADSRFFPEIQDAARKLDEAVCKAIVVPTHKSITDGFPRDEVTAFGALVKKKAGAKLGSDKLDKLNEQLDYFETTLTTGDLYPVAMPRFNVEKSTDPRDQIHYYFFTGNQKKQGSLTPTVDAKCQADETLKEPCKMILDQLDEAIFPYQRNATAFTAYETRVKLTALAEDWDAYFESARTQTFADIFVTTFLERSHFKKDYLVGPPERQWFILHPNLAMELVDAAPDGENLKASFYIEWVGVNWWQDSIIGIPFGVSLASVYSDRPEVDDVGHGVTLHFDNKYVIGYANHNGEDGFYMSMDLLKLFETKKKQVDRYRNGIEVLIN